MIMRLNRYTTLRYRVNDVSQFFPGLFVSKFTVVRNDYLSEEIDKFPLFVNDQSSIIDSESKTPAVSFLQVNNDLKKSFDYGFMYKPICNHPLEFVQSTTSISLCALLIFLTFQI